MTRPARFLRRSGLWALRLGCLGLIGVVTLAMIGTSRAERLDPVRRTAVISAFRPELAAILARTEVERTLQANGIDFSLGRLGAEPVVVFASGISMVNATMATQLALERFNIRQIVFTGIAGGVDPALRIGDVAVPESWGQYLEAVFARETTDGFRLPSFAPKAFPNFGMMHPQPVELRNADHPGGIRQFWLAADPELLARARRLAGETVLEICARPDRCLSHTPKIVVGGRGVSGQAFVDHAGFRQYVFTTFAAQVLDMETAAVAAVAFANKVPYIAFRSVSDLAGGGDGENEIPTFMSLASVNAATVLERFLASR